MGLIWVFPIVCINDCVILQQFSYSSIFILALKRTALYLGISSLIRNPMFLEQDIAHYVYSFAQVYTVLLERTLLSLLQKWRTTEAKALLNIERLWLQLS